MLCCMSLVWNPTVTVTPQGKPKGRGSARGRPTAVHPSPVGGWNRTGLILIHNSDAVLRAAASSSAFRWALRASTRATLRASRHTFQRSTRHGASERSSALADGARTLLTRRRLHLWVTVRPWSTRPPGSRSKRARRPHFERRHQGVPRRRTSSRSRQERTSCWPSSLALRKEACQRAAAQAYEPRCGGCAARATS